MIFTKFTVITSLIFNFNSLLKEIYLFNYNETLGTNRRTSFEYLIKKSSPLSTKKC